MEWSTDAFLGRWRYLVWFVLIIRGSLMHNYKMQIKLCVIAVNVLFFLNLRLISRKKIILSETSLFSLSFKCIFFTKGFLFENIIVIYKKRPDALIWSSCAMKLKIVELWCKTKLGNVFKFCTIWIIYGDLSVILYS